MNINSHTICIVEDNDTMRLGISESLQREGYRVQAFADAPAALNYLNEHPADLVISDLRMEPMDGLQLLEEIKQRQPLMAVLMISAYGTVQDAVKAMRLGAADFLTKPFSPDELRVRVAKIIQSVAQEKLLDRLQEHNRYLEEELSQEYEQMVGRSVVMQEVFRLIDRVAVQESAVLISGESGTGKELVARAIHRKSKRSEKPFVRLNCAALNENLLESELFGHEKGAFTGAIRQKKGRFELAEAGTLFLDEVGDLSAATQVKLLRVLQEKEFERVGGEQTLRADVRIIAATNRDLRELIARERFREDLYYRLNVIPIPLPALRERREDIPLLAEHFLKKLNSSKRIDAAGMKLLQAYPWPGNIRELENFVERLAVIAPQEVISAGVIAAHLQPPGSHFKYTAQHGSLNEALYNFEKTLLIEAMDKAGGVKNRAAKLLGIRTSALYYKLEKFGLLK